LPTLNEGDYLAYTVRWLLENNAMPGLELIIVDDGSTDLSVQKLKHEFADNSSIKVVAGQGCGPGNARNLGAHRAAGEFVIFLDAHCHTPAGWLEGMLAPLTHPAVGLVGCAFADLRNKGQAATTGVGCTWNDPSLQLQWLAENNACLYPVPLLPGGCQAMRREDFLSFGQYDHGMSHIGSEGEEQSLRCWLMGYSVVVQPKIVVHHLFRDQPPYAVNTAEMIFNRLRLALIHFSEERAARVFEALKNYEHFAQQVVAVQQSDVMEHRSYWQSRRIRDDDWFFNAFNVTV